MKKGKRYKKTNKLRKALIVLLSIVFLICIAYLSIHHYRKYANKNLYHELYKDIEQDKQGQEADDLAQSTDGLINKIMELQKENTDIKGWLTIKDTNINYPILQTENNDYYLNHNFKKEKTPYGSIFINCNSSLNQTNSNLIIYGHNMKNGQMFSDLTKYKDKSFYDQHQDIKLTIKEEKQNYKIVCVFQSKIYDKQEEVNFKYYQYIDLSNEDIYNEYIYNCKENQLYDTEETANYGEQLITLVTCEYSQENGRMVVVAKKVEENT